MKKTFKQFGLAVLIVAIALNAMLITGCNSGDEEYILPEDRPVKDRWGKWIEPDSTAKVDYSVDNDGVCKITVGGIAMSDNWKAKAAYYYTAMAGAIYYYTFEAWTESGTRELNFQYNTDNDEEVYFGEGVSLTNVRQTYTVIGQPLSKGVLNQVEFQCAKQLGTFYVKMLEIKTEYTDVVYSQDGSKVTLYIDGVGVPVTWAQRAMSTDLARMAFDYFEVIFIANGTTVRGQWELGQSPGISGVARGINYAWSAGSTASDPVALLAVGRKDSKTLLGIGNIREVDGAAGTIINTGTKSVTFYIEAIKTGLVADGDPPSNTDSFDFVSSGSTIPTWTRPGHSARIILSNNNVSYPAYFLPEGNNTQNAKYEFFGAAATFAQQIRLSKTTTPYVNIERRVPRYKSGGRYMQPINGIDTKTTFTLGTYTSTAGSPFVPVIPLVFTTSGTGIFSFYIEIPVYILTNTNDAVAWNIRTGFGSELYSLDDGVGSGGCVLMSVGLSSADWLEIDWTWIK